MKSAKKLASAQAAGALIRRHPTELAFLPAALEIVETPPSPAHRAIAVTIITLFCLALAWASLSEIDIEASAPGTVIPTGRTKSIQPFQIGVVREIYVRDGQSVTAGETLIELDPTLGDADLKHTQADLVSTQLEIARLNAALSDKPDPLAEFHPPDGADPTLVAAQRQFLWHMVSEQRAKLDVLDRQKAQKEGERATVLATIAKDQAVIPVLQQTTDVWHTLYSHETGSKVNYLNALQQLVLAQKDLPIQQGNLAAAEQAITTIEAERIQADEEYRRTLLDSLASAQAKEADLTQDLVKAKELQKRQILTAPVDGVVQQLAVHTVGGVVTPAQPLMVVVPKDSKLEIEAMISNRDIGFIHPGQDAEIKVGTFDFTRFGLLQGKVISVSADAITPSSAPGASSSSGGKTEGKDSGQPAQVGGASGDDGTAVYSALISLNSTQMIVDHKPVNLEPGMAVTVEIKTGARRVISYLLSPLLRYKQDTLRER
jgi:hemolysin D